MTGAYLAILAVVVLLVVFAIAQYNSLIRLNNSVSEGFAQIEVQLRRRSDLIPNLVETVKGYAAHEKEALENVVQARAAGRFEVLGPAPAALGRVRGSHRVQFFLKGTNRALLRLAIRAALEECGELRRRVGPVGDRLLEPRHVELQVVGHLARGAQVLGHQAGGEAGREVARQQHRERYVEVTEHSEKLQPVYIFRRAANVGCVG